MWNVRDEISKKALDAECIRDLICSVDRGITYGYGGGGGGGGGEDREFVYDDTVKGMIEW